MLYKDPGNIAPKKFVKVNISARDDAALARRRYAENNKVDFLHLQEGRDNQVCSGTYLDFDSNNNTSKVLTRCWILVKHIMHSSTWNISV
jgi:hypothetical protein